MKKWMILILVVLFCSVSVSSAKVTVGLVGNDDELSLRIGYRPVERGEFGLYGIYTDGLAEGYTDAAGGGAYATWDIYDRPLNFVGIVDLPVRMYIGGMLGGLSVVDKESPDRRRGDATAGLLTGWTFGDGNVRLGVEAQYRFTKDNWKELAEIDDQSKFLLTLSYHF
jgi:hypothetical protein